MRESYLYAGEGGRIFTMRRHREQPLASSGIPGF
jgi:hypothetical protein